MPLGLPDPRPSKAHPEHRGKRKELEKEVSAFESFTSVGMKVGVIALLAAAAVIGEAKYDEHLQKEENEARDRYKKQNSKNGKNSKQNRGPDDRDKDRKSRSQSGSSSDRDSGRRGQERLQGPLDYEPRRSSDQRHYDDPRYYNDRRYDQRR